MTSCVCYATRFLCRFTDLTVAFFVCLFIVFFFVSFAVQFLYTLVIEDQNKADKLTQSLPPGLPQKHI